MCFETACLVIAKGSASSLTVAGPRLSRAMMRRRTGSARARKAASSSLVVACFHSVSHLLVPMRQLMQ